MESGDEPRIFLAQAALTQRRPITALEYRSIRKQARRAYSVAWSAILGLATAYSVAAATRYLFGVRLEVIVISVALFTIVGVSAFLLYGRDGFVSARRLSSIEPKSEVLTFTSRADVRPITYTVIAPANLLVATHQGTLPIPVPVQPTEVAPASLRTAATADWMESVRLSSANRRLEPSERAELSRLLARIRFRLQWWEWFLLVWAGLAPISILAGLATSTTQIVTRMLIFVVIYGIDAIRLARYFRTRRVVKQCLETGMVKVRAVPGPEGRTFIVETLMPEGLPWSAEGHPAAWRAL